MRYFVRWAGVLTLTSFALTSVFGASLTAQVSGDGAISGYVESQSGAPVSQAGIVATNAATGVQVKRESIANGFFGVSPLPAGNYKVEVDAKGYRRLIQENVKVTSSRNFGLDLRLTEGSGDTVIIAEPPVDVPMTSTNGATIEKDLYTVETASIATRAALGNPGAAPSARSPAPAKISKPGAGAESVAAVPLFRDPVHDGAADPVVVWNRGKKVWWMLYTNRRADFAGGGVEWVHGTHIGIAESADGGAHWKYVGEADIPYGKPDYTFWAPEVIYTGGTYHMFLTVVEGTFGDWNHPRHILHLTSKDLLHWKPLAYVNLPSEKTIDACVFKLKAGTWRLWYKNEAAGSRIWYSDSKDLVHWEPKGVAIKNVNGEGPIVFQWRGSYWMLEDTAPGLSVFRSSDLENWTRQPDKILLTPGTQPTDRMEGKHPDVVVDGEGRAWIFYFTQQGGPDAEGHDRLWARRSVLHVSELHEEGGVLTVDRNGPAHIHMLPPPMNKKSDMAGTW